MDPQGLLPWSLLLFLGLAFGRGYGAGEDAMSCPKVVRQLGGDVLLPLTSNQIQKSSNKSIHILVTMAKFRESSLKRKVVSVNPAEGGSPSYLEKGHHFDLKDLSLRILGSKRESEGWYFISLEENTSVQHFCVQLVLYDADIGALRSVYLSFHMHVWAALQGVSGERELKSQPHSTVSTPEIKVLKKSQENETCSLLLACAAEKGDQVSYSWSEEPGAPLQSPPNGSHLLHLDLGPQQANSTFTCTASNPVSNRSQSFSPWHLCTARSSGSRPWGLYSGLLLGGVMGILMILQVAILLLRRGKASRLEPAVEEKSLTVYAQVQQPGVSADRGLTKIHPVDQGSRPAHGAHPPPQPQQRPDPPPAQNLCSTIYVAASEPVPEPTQEPAPITVYASVTLPES